jgi:hypothetical protein
MAGSSDANNMPGGTTLVFGSWACTADGSDGFSSHLVTPDSSKPKAISQLVDIQGSTDPDEKRVLLELNSDNTENVSTPTRTLGSVKFGTNSDSEKPHFSETLEKYVTDLKTIKRPKINNSELLVGVDRVSRSIKGCIKLAEFAIGPSTSHQNPEVLNPPQKRSGDILSGIDRIDSKIGDCIKMAEDTLQNLKQKSGGGICERAGETNSRLVQMGPSISRIPQNPSPKTAHIQTLEPAESSFDQDFD